MIITLQYAMLPVQDAIMTVQDAILSVSGCDLMLPLRDVPLRLMQPCPSHDATLPLAHSACTVSTDSEKDETDKRL